MVSYYVDGTGSSCKSSFINFLTHVENKTRYVLEAVLNIAQLEIT